MKAIEDKILHSRCAIFARFTNVLKYYFFFYYYLSALYSLITLHEIVYEHR